MPYLTVIHFGFLVILVFPWGICNQFLHHFSFVIFQILPNSFWINNFPISTTELILLNNDKFFRPNCLQLNVPKQFVSNIHLSPLNVNFFYFVRNASKYNSIFVMKFKNTDQKAWRVTFYISNKTSYSQSNKLRSQVDT